MTPEEPNAAADEAPVRPFVQRVAGALQLQRAVYDEIAADPDATNQSAVVVAIAALAQAFGGPERIPMEELPFPHLPPAPIPFHGLRRPVLRALIGWKRLQDRLEAGR